ncbi:MAG: nucleotidyltransferase domain-containing protein [Pseudomonadota bacterium]|jgi:predicted nucleotidyltransferase
MRLSEAQKKEIIRILRGRIGDDAEIFIYGSRLNEAARGGDIDIYIELSCPLSALDQAKIQLELETRLGLPVDLLVHFRQHPMTAFHEIAKHQAVKIWP